MKPPLVLFTIGYPDPFINNELPILTRLFGKVYLLPAFPCDTSCPVEGVELVNLFESKVEPSITLLLKHFLSFCRVYLFTIFRNRNFIPYIRYYRSFIGHFLNEATKVAAIEEFIKMHNLRDAVFYDYWLVDSTLAIAELKRRGLIKHAVARAHRFDLYDDSQFEGRLPFLEYRLKYLDGVFTISSHGYNYLVAKLSDAHRSKVRLRYLGVHDRFVTTPPRAHDDYVIVSCSAMLPLKRLELICKVLCLTSVTIRWVHFGDGPERALLEEQAKDLPNNVKVDFRGSVANEEVLSYYRENHVDLFVSLSEVEGLPVSMMEAQCFGIPILAANVGGVGEIVNETTGVLVEANLPSYEIVKVLESTLVKGFDRKAIRSHFSDNFNADMNYREFVNDIYQIIGQKSKAAI